MEDNKSENEKRLEKYLWPDGDPAIVNPEELATFPRAQSPNYSKDELNEMRDPHLVNKKVSPVRSGRNITQTGTNTNENGFM